MQEGSIPTVVVATDFCAMGMPLNENNILVEWRSRLLALVLPDLV
jgi:hypothetical protein